MLLSRVQQSRRVRVIRREVCPHCGQNLSAKTLKRHRALFLKGDGTWIKSSVESNDSDDADDGDVEGRHIVARDLSSMVGLTLIHTV